MRSSNPWRFRTRNKNDDHQRDAGVAIPDLFQTKRIPPPNSIAYVLYTLLSLARNPERGRFVEERARAATGDEMLDLAGSGARPDTDRDDPRLLEIPA